MCFIFSNQIKCLYFTTLYMKYIKREMRWKVHDVEDLPHLIGQRDHLPCPRVIMWFIAQLACFINNLQVITIFVEINYIFKQIFVEKCLFSQEKSYWYIFCLITNMWNIKCTIIFQLFLNIYLSIYCRELNTLMMINSVFDFYIYWQKLCF